MENIEWDKNIHNMVKNTHKSHCIECPAFNECMGVWLNYFSGKGEKV